MLRGIPPAPARQERVFVKLTVTSDGELTVQASTRTGITESMSIELNPRYFEKLSIIEEETPRATASATAGVSPDNGNPITTEEETPNFLTVPNRDSDQTS